MSLTDGYSRWGLGIVGGPKRLNVMERVNGLGGGVAWKIATVACRSSFGGGCKQFRLAIMDLQTATVVSLHYTEETDRLLAPLVS